MIQNAVYFTLNINFNFTISNKIHIHFSSNYFNRSHIHGAKPIFTMFTVYGTTTSVQKYIQVLTRARNAKRRVSRRMPTCLRCFPWKQRRKKGSLQFTQNLHIYEESPTHGIDVARCQGISDCANARICVRKLLYKIFPYAIQKPICEYFQKLSRKKRRCVLTRLRERRSVCRRSSLKTEASSHHCR